MPTYPTRQSIRLRNYDYSQEGAYFLTLRAEGRKAIFGVVENGQVALTETGLMVQEIWTNVPKYRAGVELDVFVVMPNHMHAIVVLPCLENSGGRTGTSAPTVGNRSGGRTGTSAPTDGTKLEPKGQTGSSVPEVVQRFKTFTTKQWQKSAAGTLSAPSRLWQRNYYEHVIRDESDLAALRDYVVNNPLKWALDRANPLVAGQTHET